MHDDKSSKNTLTIHLAESAVFLRGTNASGRSHHHNDSAPGMVRGLLVLNIVKPTRVTSIDLELFAKSVTSWPEGFGARRIDSAEEHKLFSASTVLFRAGGAPRRTTSLGPGIAVAADDVADEHSDDEHHALAGPSRRRPARRLSADSTIFHRDPLSRSENLPLPPYSPPADAPASPMHTHPSLDSTPAQTLEDFRNALRASDHRSPSGSHAPTLANSSSSSSLRGASLSRRPSFDDVPEVDSDTSASATPASGPSSSGLLSPPVSSPGAHSPAGVTPLPSPAPSLLGDEHRGRRHSRFSLASVLDAVRSRSRTAGSDGTVSRERSGHWTHEREASSPRGRTRDKVPAGSPATPTPAPSAHQPKPLDVDEKKAKEGWKEFKKGTYTYPISFSVPGDAPPTLECDYGTVKWRLKANVHRPGTFTSRLSTMTEVLMVACPGEEDTQDTENILVERHWEAQLQYLIAVSGRSFYIGGTVPIQFTMMPLAKIKVHRISVFVEERVDYYTQMKRLTRSDPITRVELLALKAASKDGGPILPLESDDADALLNSPLAAVLPPGADASQMAAELMGPGPWTFAQDLQLPRSCALLRASNRNRRANILVNHVLKVVMRVERGDDEALDPRTGKRKLFDIVVQAPVQILNCRCDPAWVSLPQYSRALSGTPAPATACPCEVKAGMAPPPALARLVSRRSSDSDPGVLPADTAAVDPARMASLRPSESLVAQNALFERLVSGQESEVGEAPPAYDSVGVRATVRVR